MGLVLLAVAACSSSTPSLAQAPEAPEDLHATVLPESPIARDAPMCAGATALPKERPHKMACCYPAKEALLAPIRAAFPAFRTCWEGTDQTEARVGFRFRIEQDGSVERVCSDTSTTLKDDAALRCILDEMLKIKWPAQTNEDVDNCGLVSLSYPLEFKR